MNELNEFLLCTYTQERNGQFINIWTYQEGETGYLYKSMHTFRGVAKLFIYIQESTKEEPMVRLSAYQHMHVKILPSVLSMLFFTHSNDPHQQTGSSSYVINVATLNSTHKCFAFVPVCRSESVIHPIPLTLLLQPK